MNDIETVLTGALHAQAHDAHRSAPAPDATGVVVRVDYLGRGTLRRRERHRRGQVALAASASVAAAAIAALAVGLLTHVGSSGGTGHASAGAAASAASTPSPYGLKPGQYLEVGGPPGGTFIPADPYGTWVRTTYVVTTGSNGQVAERQRTTATCAVFPDVNPFVTPAKVPGCTAAYGWVGPYRPPFAASLPSDPAAIRASLVAAAQQSGNSAWTLATTFLDTGFVPNPVALRVIDAVKGLPGVSVSHHVANGAGDYGDAITFHPPFGTGDYAESTIFDPATGQVIGTATDSPAIGRRTHPISYRVTTSTD